MNEPLSPDPAEPPRLWRYVMIAAEILMVFVIIGLLVLNWLPAFIGARHGVGR
jgi:hypothetical protein